MSQRTFSLTAGVIFLLITLGHLSRLVFRWEVMLAGRPVPFSIHWIAMFIFGFLAYEGFRLSKKSL